MRAAIFAFTVFTFLSVNLSFAGTPAQDFVDKLGKRALTSLVDKSISIDTRETRTRKLLRDFFDVPSISRFALGKHWRSATEAEKKEYTRLFEDMIVKTYATRFEEYGGQTFEVGEEKTVNKRDTLVSSQILQKNGPPVNLEWRVRQKNGSFKIIDVVVEGISMSVTQRSDFDAVIYGGGGKISALLDSLRKRRDGAKKNLMAKKKAEKKKNSGKDIASK